MQVTWWDEGDGGETREMVVRQEASGRFPDLCSALDIRRLAVLPWQHANHLGRQTGQWAELEVPLALLTSHAM